MKIVQNSLIHRVCCEYGRMWFSEWNKEPDTVCGFIFWSLMGVFFISVFVVIWTAVAVCILEGPIVIALRTFVGDGGYGFFGTFMPEPITIFAGSCLLWVVAFLTGFSLTMIALLKDSKFANLISDVCDAIYLKTPTLSCSMVDYVSEDDENED